jgi:hypothetical protein
VVCSHIGNGKGRGKTSLVEGYQILRCGEEYPGSVGRGSFPGIRATRRHLPEDDNHLPYVFIA